MTKKRIIALVPLKANSERVPAKNFRMLAGKPLFAWIIDTLLSIPEISQIIVNTDARDKLIAHGLSESSRLRIRDRKADLCGDFVSMNRILLDDMADSDADLYLMTHVTNPLISANTITAAIERFLNADGHYDSLFSVNRFQNRFYLEDGNPLNHDPQNLIRTQDLPPLYEENSCLYLFTKDSFASTNARIGNRPLMYPTPKLESVDIDYPEDWALAEALASVLYRESIR